MNFFAQVGKSGKVHTITPSENDMIKISSNDERIIGTRYDPETGTFVGMKVALSIDKSQIDSDGVDTATVTASIYNWDDTVSEYDGDIVFDVDGQIRAVDANSGLAEITFSSQENGVHEIKTVNDNMMSNGLVVINVV